LFIGVCSTTLVTVAPEHDHKSHFCSLCNVTQQRNVDSLRTVIVEAENLFVHLRRVRDRHTSHVPLGTVVGAEMSELVDTALATTESWELNFAA
jgi:hypothetical protein